MTIRILAAMVLIALLLAIFFAPPRPGMRGETCYVCKYLTGNTHLVVNHA